jgi:DNA repair exonuclease SbcCD ATPase subunit
MPDIIHNMEHPMVSEIRAQMEVQQSEYETKLAEKQGKIDDLEADINDLDGTFSQQYHQIDSKISEIKRERQKAKEEGKPIPKFTIDDFAGAIHSSDKVYGSCAINILKEVSSLLELVDVEVETKTVYQTVPVTKSVPYIPSKIKELLSNLSEEINNYI